MGDDGRARLTPATVEKVKQIVQRDLAACDAEQRAAYHRYSVEPHAAPIVRHGKSETVVVVARRGNEVVYWEDVEEGFNTSPLDGDGTILEHWCNPGQTGYSAESLDRRPNIQLRSSRLILG